METKKKIVVFASGRGSNFLAIAEKINDGYLKAEISLLVSDNPSAGAIHKAEKLGIKSVVINWKNRTHAEETASKILDAVEPDLIVLAGFMKVLSPSFVAKWRNKILNIHPSILPAFAGTTKAIELSWSYGVKIAGCTVHIVDETVDLGPVLVQAAIPVTDTIESYEEKIHKVEHIIYPLAIKILLEGKVIINGRSVKVVHPEAGRFIIIPEIPALVST